MSDSEKNNRPWVMVKLFLMSPEKDKSWCGPGMIKLLKAIEKTGSVHQACEEMNMSYSKGWKLLREMEDWLDCPVIIRRQGGKGGGEARLTDMGRDFLKWQGSFDEDCQKAIQEIFERHYRAFPRPDSGGTAQGVSMAAPVEGDRE
jgi:molybdate transport system regulatory protein